MISRIYDAIKNFFSNIYSSAKSDPEFKKYLLVSIVFFFVFLFLLFPYESIILRTVKNYEGKAYRSLVINAFKMPLFSGFSASSFSYASLTGNDISASSINTGIGLIEIITGKLSGNISAESFTFSNRSTNITGKLNSDLDISIDKNSGIISAGTAEIQADNLSINGITFSGITIPPFTVKKLNAEFKFSGTTYEITKIVFTDKSLNGSIKGKIAVNQKMFKSSQLDILFEIDPSSELLQSYMIILNSKINKETNKIEIRLGGTVGNPEIK